MHLLLAVLSSRCFYCPLIAICLCFVSLPPALCHFSDSILEYLANLDKAPDPTVRKDTFSSEICVAFDILFNNWLQSRESKVRSLSVCGGAKDLTDCMVEISNLFKQCSKKLRQVLTF